MQAGTATVINPRVKLRQQLMNDGTETTQLDESVYHRQGNQYVGPAPVNNMNYEYGGINTGAGSRKASLTSQSGVQRFFRRNKAGGGGGGGFDDDVGADMSDMTSAINMSIDDLSHIRDRGRYGMNSMSSSDTTPLIPIIGGGSSSNKTPSNNVEYRKQMNYNKKLAMAMGSQSRANTMSGPNPMIQQFNGMDSRTMSLNSFGQDPRMMSLNSNSVGPNGPRTMSLNNRMQMNGMMPNQQYDPRAMSLNNRMPPPPVGNYTGHPMDPRSMSMRSNGFPNPNMQPMGPNGQYGAGPRTMSLNNQPNYPGNYPQNFQNGGAPYHGNNFIASPRALNDPSFRQPQNSNDSIMNVVEEEEDQVADEAPFSNSKDILNDTIDSKDEQYEDNEDQDVVYDLDKESEGLSRKTTLKKSNSMKLRKLDLFDDSSQNDGDREEEDHDIVGNAPGSPKFNIKNSLGNRESIIADEYENTRRQENREKFRSIGANATTNTSNASVSTKDVFTTATDFISPTKSVKSVKSANLTLMDTKSEVENTHLSADDETFEDEGGEEEKVCESAIKDSNKSLNKKHSFKSIVENTAFNNFRGSNYDFHRVGDSEQREKVMKTSQSDSIIERGSSRKDSDIRKGVHDPSMAEELSDDIQPKESSDYQGEKSDIFTVSNTSSSNVTSSDGTERKPAFNKSDINPSYVPSTENSSLYSQSDKKDKGITKSLSFSDKSKNFLKKLSKSKRISTPVINDESANNSFVESRNNSISSNIGNSTRRLSSFSVKSQSKQPVLFSKEELGIMTCNNELLNELQLVTMELASSIKRELSLEAKSLKTPTSPMYEGDQVASVLEKVKTISELQEKLNKERKLRFISEEHALLLENGQSPSAIKLGYENAELYNQLLMKNDLVNQLQHKIKEAEEKTPEPDRNLLHNYNELLKENTDFKLNIVPELKNQLAQANEKPNRYPSTSSRQLSLANGVGESNQDQIEEVAILKSQRDELRETIQQLTAKHSYETKLANDKIKALEMKLNNVTSINSKLSKRVDSHNLEVTNGQATSPINTRGGKLQGFNVITSSKSFYNE